MNFDLDFACKELLSLNIIGLVLLKPAEDTGRVEVNIHLLKIKEFFLRLIIPFKEERHLREQKDRVVNLLIIRVIRLVNKQIVTGRLFNIKSEVVDHVEIFLEDLFVVILLRENVLDPH